MENEEFNYHLSAYYMGTGVVEEEDTTSSSWMVVSLFIGWFIIE